RLVTVRKGEGPVKRLVTGGALIVFALAGLAGTAAARGPDGRVFSGAKFSAGVSGDASVAVTSATSSTTLVPGPLVRVSTDQRVTDPWVDFGPSNRVYAFSLGFDDTGPDNGLFVNTSTDGGLTWGAPVPVIIDRQFEFFNDKNALAVDNWASSPNRRNVYLAWDRLAEDPLGKPFVGTYSGPAMFSRST